MSNAGSGIAIGTLTTLVFVVLRLTDVIQWSWWWVFAPLWMPLSLLALVMIVGLIAGYIGYKSGGELS